ncbi:hypothetical protein COV18_05850 [Candidatus Woesearchaeota archaeon CG10_big_fil_rev_8_21_14_0_10_37_12]|nr:MAG: hypothetical protein COV18_05850 [Candidatus Woesearchaeota archaeon CG10_big_fil_rev_8_21_14_0_10_37_12]
MLENVFLERILEQLFILINAPRLAPELWWVAAPLLFTLLVMSFYFGLYKKEELGWNTALGNTIVLLFVGIDLLRTLYHYTRPASFENFLFFWETLLLVCIILIEALLLFYFAFTHALPKHIMFFLASPLPVNVQAYVIACVVYLQLNSTWFLLFAAIVLFLGWLIFLTLAQLVERWLVMYWQVKSVEKVKEMQKEAKHLRKKANVAREDEAKELRGTAKNLVKKAKEIKEDIITSEKEQKGKVEIGKDLIKKKKKKQYD